MAVAGRNGWNWQDDMELQGINVSKIGRQFRWTTKIEQMLDLRGGGGLEEGMAGMAVAVSLSLSFGVVISSIPSGDLGCSPVLCVEKLTIEVLVGRGGLWGIDGAGELGSADPGDVGETAPARSERLVIEPARTMPDVEGRGAVGSGGAKPPEIEFLIDCPGSSELFLGKFISIELECKWRDFAGGVRDWETLEAALGPPGIIPCLFPAGYLFSTLAHTGGRGKVCAAAKFLPGFCGIGLDSGTELSSVTIITASELSSAAVGASKLGIIPAAVLAGRAIVA
jgi:hypothetical protein